MSRIISASISEELHEKLMKKVDGTISEYLRGLIEKDNITSVIESEKKKDIVFKEIKNKRGMVLSLENAFDNPVLIPKREVKQLNVRKDDYWRPTKSIRLISVSKRIKDRLYKTRGFMERDMYDVMLIKAILNQQDNQITNQQVNEVQELINAVDNTTIKRWVHTIQEGLLDNEISEFNDEIILCKFMCTDDNIIIDGQVLPVDICKEICYVLQNVAKITEYVIYRRLKYYDMLGYSKYAVYCVCKHYDDVNLLKLINNDVEVNMLPVNTQKRRESLKNIGGGI